MRDLISQRIIHKKGDEKKMKKVLSTILILTFALMVFSSNVIAGKEEKKVEIVCVVSFVMGNAMIKKAGTKKWESLKLKTKVTKYDEIKTSAKSSVKIRLKNKRIAVIKSRKTVKKASLLKKPVKVKGSLKSVFSKTKKDKKSEFGVTAVGGVRGDDVSKKKQKVKSDELQWDEE